MRFVIAIEGAHIEGHEGKTRFDKIVSGFIAALATAGFQAVNVTASHDADSVVVPEVAEPETPETVTEAEPAVIETVEVAPKKKSRSKK